MQKNIDRKNDLVIKKYLLDVMLPKCNLVFGNLFSSVYLQLLMHINYDNCKWKINKTWISANKIAENINCSPRKVSQIINNMLELGLIEKSYHGKLYMYSLNEVNDTSIDLIKEYILSNDKKLLNYVAENNIKQIYTKFMQMNNNIAIDNYIISNKQIAKKNILLVEKIYRGSSLMYLQLQCNKLFNESEKDIADKLGCSQSTVSRFLTSYKTSNINLENDLLERNVIMEEKQLFECPICKKEIDSLKKLQSHVCRCKDQLHSLLQDILEDKDIKKCSYEEIVAAYENNKDKFESITNEKENEKKKNNSLAISLVKYYYGLTNSKCPSWAKEMNLVKSHINNGLQPDEIMEVMRYMAKRGYQDLRFFNNSINDALTIKQAKIECKQEGTDAYIVKFYYDKLKAKGMNTGISDRLMLQGLQKIRELKSNGYDYSKIKLVVEYMVEKNCPNFNFIVTMANEALAKVKDKDELTKAYTLSELVTITLDGILEYGNVIITDCDYNIAKKDIILRLKDDICQGKVDLTRVNSTYNKFAIELAKEIYKRHDYNTFMNTEEWINKIQLNKVQ